MNIEERLCKLLDEKRTLDKNLVKLSAAMNDLEFRQERQADGHLPLLEEQYKAMIALSAIVTRRIAMLWEVVSYAIPGESTPGTDVEVTDGPETDKSG